MLKKILITLIFCLSFSLNPTTINISFAEPGEEGGGGGGGGEEEGGGGGGGEEEGGGGGGSSEPEGPQSGGYGGKKFSTYDQALKKILYARRLEEKGKKKRAIKIYKKAQKILLKSNKKKPNNADTLNLLGYSTRKIGNFVDGEKYYLQGLAINPNHNGINEYLGELYVVTNRMDLARERLEVLKTCNCKEYELLKAYIEGQKSKY